ncbi:MAG: bifunctional 3'-5' exonuclease/DNA polymerase [Microbacteriaceae bacterium]
MLIVLARGAAGVVARRFDEDGAPLGAPETVDDLAAFVREREPGRPRWVWDDSRAWYPALLRAGVRVERCLDLRLCHAILRGSASAAGSALQAAPPGPWDAAAEPAGSSEPAGSPGPAGPLGAPAALFDLAEGEAPPAPDPVAEWLLQRAAVAASADTARLGLLLAAESVGALIACELSHAGLPFDLVRHDALLTELLGPRPRGARRPERLERLRREFERLLGVGEVNPDSPAELLRALHRAGIRTASTRSWELRRLEHPAIAPLLEYKALARLASANGWRWAEEWVSAGRFRPSYLPGGVVTGRWAASGGGALQLPRQLRGAVVADPGWLLVVADAAQLEPRVLAALSADAGMAAAGRGDLYEGIVASGAVATRAQAKVALLGAMYGATTGESGRLLPGLERAFPRAVGLVERAARAGERGEVVTTLLGRSSPPPDAGWHEAQAAAGRDAASEARARSQGRFTRNFVVQGTAAEWALSWMGLLRARLWELGPGSLTAGAHLVYFLHDEVIVHTPAEHAETVLELVRDCAAEAGRLLFGGSPVRVGFPVTAVAVRSYAEAK